MATIQELQKQLAAKQAKKLVGVGCRKVTTDRERLQPIFAISNRKPLPAEKNALASGNQSVTGFR